MQTHPWSLFPDGKPVKEVKEIGELIEIGRRINPQHIGLLHLQIHFSEMNPAVPRWGADALDALGPQLKDLSHLHHMPSHVFVQYGEYLRCIECNERARVTASRILQHSHDMWLFAAYLAHDSEFYMWACMLAGIKDKAENAAKYIKEELASETFLRSNELNANANEFYHAMDYIVMFRFGEWERILEQPVPTDVVFYAGSLCLLTFARGIAYGVLGRTQEGRKEEKKLLNLIATSDVLRYRAKHNVTLPEMLAVATTMLDGELSYREKKYDYAFKKLEEAVQLEDDLPYDEPWGWLVPTRHALAALLLEQNECVRAEEVYRADLRRFPKNVWSLVGLRDCLRTQGKGVSEEMEAQVVQAQRLATVPIKTSCACALSRMQG